MNYTFLLIYDLVYLCWTPARNSAFCTGQYLISVQFNIGNIIIELNFCCQSDQAYIIFINSEAFQIRTGLRLWQYRLSSFQAGYTKLERFLPKNQHSQRNNWILKIGLMGRCQNLPKFDFQSQFSTSKIIRNI